MVKRIGTARRKTRHLFAKASYKDKGKIKLRDYFMEYEAGDKVILKAEPAVQKGLFFRRFYGKVGTILRKKGTCYEVSIKDFNKEKTVITHPVHLKKVN